MILTSLLLITITLSGALLPIAPANTKVDKKCKIVCP